MVPSAVGDGVIALIVEVGRAGEKSPAFPNFNNFKLAFLASHRKIYPLCMEHSSTSTDSLLKILAWLDQNKKRVGLITGAVVLAVGLIALIFYYQSQKEVRASEALSNVRKPFNPSVPAPPETAQAFLKVARDFEGTKAAGRALLEAASLLYAEGSYTNAETQYRRFLNEYPDSPFLPQGMLGLASTLDAEGKTTDARDKYEELRRRFPSDSVIDETKLALARIYERDKPAEAFKLYNELVALGSQSGVGSEAGMRMADLVEKHPELTKTNAPPTAAVTSAQPTPQVSVTRPGSTNQMVMTLSNFANRPSTSAPATPSKTATGATSAPLLLNKPTVSTNQP
jgi:predicted negative regulator of RcsB-dependent stress response